MHCPPTARQSDVDATFARVADWLRSRISTPIVVPVDDRLHTNVQDVWALGDLRASDMFTHTARDDAEVTYRTAFKDEDRTIADRVSFAVQ